MKIGIIGAENSHTAAISKTLNIDTAVKGVEVSMLWGETEEFAQAAAQEGAVWQTVQHPREMLGKVDAIVVDHRHAKHHLKAATPFIKAGVPTFIDKPFCYRAKEGIEFLRLARAHGTPVTSFGLLPEQKSFERFVGKIRELNPVTSGATYGPCDLKSPYGGVFFYGIHQVEMVLYAFGFDVKEVIVTVNGANAVAQCLYPDGLTVSIHLFSENYEGFSMSASGEEGVISAPITFDKNMFLTGIKRFVDLFKTGQEPLSYEKILKPVFVLEAMQRSIRSKNRERVETAPKDLRD